MYLDNYVETISGEIMCKMRRLDEINDHRDWFRIEMDINTTN